jgi:hypothetical protein
MLTQTICHCIRNVEASNLVEISGTVSRNIYDGEIPFHILQYFSNRSEMPVRKLHCNREL